VTEVGVAHCYVVLLVVWIRRMLWQEPEKE